MNEQNTWHLVADVRTGLLRRWIPLAAAILIMVLLQTVGGRYEEHSTTLLAWSWLALGVLPGTLMLYFSSWMNKYPAKLVAPSAYRSLRGIAIAHLVLMLITLLLLPIALQNMNTQDFLNLSLLWVVLGSAIVSAGFYLLFFRKESRLRPNALILKEVAQQEAEKARKAGSIERLQCLELVAANELGEALQLLRTSLAHSPDDTDQVVMLQARYKEVTERLNKGLLDESVAQLEINKITESLLNLTKLIKN